MAIDARIPLMGQHFDAGAMLERHQNMRLRDMMAEQQREEFDFRKQQAAAQTAKAQREEQTQMATRLSKLANVANEQNWGSVRRAAIGLGVDPSMIPEAYDPGFIEQQKAAFALLSDPQQADKVDRDLQRAGYKPGTQEYIDAARALIFKPQVVADAMGGVRIVPTEPGAYNQFMQGNQPPATLTDDDILKMEGGSGGNAGGTFQP